MMKNLISPIAICLFWCWCMARCRAFTKPSPARQTYAHGHSFPSLFSVETSSSTIVTADDQDEKTVVSITNPKTGQVVTLIGTAHLSEKSNDQVQKLIENLQPDAVMIEMDPSRLERIGIESADNIRIEKVTDAEDIVLPMAPQKNTNGFLGMAQTAFVGAFSQAARLFLTQMYKSLENDMDQKAGGEFLRAIQSAENCTATGTVILGDRNSVETIKRMAQLAMESGDFFGVLNRLKDINTEEMDKFDDQMRKELLRQKGQEDNDQFVLDETEVITALMEALKEDEEFRTRLFSKIEQGVPEFTQAFLKERDYVMSESIRRELDQRPKEVQTVVGVVGLAHVPGMEKHFQAVFADRPAPLIQDISNVAAE